GSMLRRALIGSAIAALVAAAACASFTAETATTPDAGATDAGATDAGWIRCSERPVRDPAHFCADFDDINAPLGVDFNSGTLLTDASIDATIVALSAPRAAQISLSAGSTPSQASLWQKFTDVDMAGKKHIVVDFDFKV